MAVKCERYRKGHESYYLQPLYITQHDTPGNTMAVSNEFMPFAVPLALNSHLSPTLLPGELRTKRLTAVVQTVTASVTVWLRETTKVQCLQAYGFIRISYGFALENTEYGKSRLIYGYIFFCHVVKMADSEGVSCGTI